MNATMTGRGLRRELRLPTTLLACLLSGSSMAASYSTLLGISNNQNWDDPPWAEVTIEDDDSQGAGGIKFTVNLCDDHALQCSSGASDDYDPGQNTIEHFGFGFDGTLTSANIAGGPANWSLETDDNLDGFGNFLYALKRGSQGDTPEPLIFWIIGVDGDTVNDYASIRSTGGQPNAGQLFAAQVSAGKDGAFIAGGTEVPLPGTLGLLGIGIAGLGAIRRRN